MIRRGYVRLLIIKYLQIIGKLTEKRLTSPSVVYIQVYSVIAWSGKAMLCFGTICVRVVSEIPDILKFNGIYLNSCRVRNSKAIPVLLLRLAEPDLHEL